jgi:hypothetical protein
MYDFHALLWLLFSCILVRTMYFITDILLYPSSKYIELSQVRRKYIQKNLIKSAYLAVLTLVAMFTIIIPIWRDNIWNNWTIHRLAALYVSNDIVGLVCVDNLPQTTRIHHMTTTVLVFLSFGLDFQTSEIGQAMLVYTMASASAYIVNFHLAVRWLSPRGSLKKLRAFAGVIYVVCCLFSWSWHIWWLYTSELWSIYHFAYISLLFLIVRDDIILMKWLCVP